MKLDLLRSKNLFGIFDVNIPGDAIVNAANEGCTGGFGVDEIINKSGGFKLKEARKLLNGCATGDAKVTPSFDHTKVSISECEINVNIELHNLVPSLTWLAY